MKFQKWLHGYLPSDKNQVYNIRYVTYEKEVPVYRLPVNKNRKTAGTGVVNYSKNENKIQGRQEANGTQVIKKDGL